MGTDINIKRRIAVQEESVTVTSDVNSINFTGDGVTASAIGDDVTVNIPGGMGNVTYYLNETVTQAPYKEFSSFPTGAVEQTILTTIGAGATSTIQSFQTPSGTPGTTNIPAGLWSFYLHFSGTGANLFNIYVEVYKRDLGGIETLLLTTDSVSVTPGASPAMTLTDGVFPSTSLLTTDRIVIKVKAQNTEPLSSPITFHTEGATNYSVSTTTLNQIVPTGAVTSVTGTAPIASSGGTTPAISISQSGVASNGYLSSTDWNTFNNKVDDNIYTADGTLAGNRIVTMNTNTLLFDGTNSDVRYTPNSVGGYLQIEGKASGVPRFGISVPAFGLNPAAGFQMGMRAWDDPTYVGYGQVGDAFFYAGNATYGLNFLNPPGVGTADYIRFYAGIDATGTSHIHIQGTGATKGYIGLGTETPTEKLDVVGKTKTTTFQMTTSPTAGYVLTSDASGNGSWTALPSGLTYFTEAQSTAAPNATVNVDSLTAVASTANADIALVPKGTGAFMLAIPDNTTTGGNKRGTGAVDLQMVRNANWRIASGNYSTIVGGIWNKAAGTYSIAGGFENQVDGDGSVAFGTSNTTTTSNCFVFGNQCTASGGFGAAALGRMNTSSGDATLTAGFNNVASGSRSVALGESNTASSGGAVGLGVGVVASGYISFASGYLTSTQGKVGRRTSGYANTSLGDCQKSQFFLSVRTTGNTATTLTTGGTAADPTNQVILSNNAAYAFEGKIIGKQSGSTNAAMWKVEGLIVRGANAASTVLTASTVTLFSNLPGWGTPTLAADTTNGGLQIQVSGLAATNIQWTAVIETTEVIYA